MQKTAEIKSDQLTFPTPVWPWVAGFDEEVAGDPWYISVFFFTPGVASVVPLDNFWHFEQTILKFCEKPVPTVAAGELLQAAKLRIAHLVL